MTTKGLRSLTVAALALCLLVNFSCVGTYDWKAEDIISVRIVNCTVENLYVTVGLSLITKTETIEPRKFIDAVVIKGRPIEVVGDTKTYTRTFHSDSEQWEMR